VLVGIVVLHIGFYYALVNGLARHGLQLADDLGIIDLPPPPPPPEDLKEPPPPPPVDVPPPVVPPPLLDLPVFEGPSSAITARVAEAPPPRVQAPPPPKPVQITAPTLRARGDRIAAAINACYPSASRRLNEEGRVVVSITIDATGKAGTMSVTQSSGFERLDAAAECVIRRLTFNPGRRDGQPVEAQAVLPIVFKLE
jgi:protein TonB